MNKNMSISSQEAKMFCKLFSCGTTAETAGYMEWSTAQVSACLNKLEEKIGKTLFVRNRRLGKFTPTIEAIQIRNPMLNILSSVDLVFAESYKEENYVSISSSQSILEYYIGPYYNDFITENPNLFVNLRQQDDLRVDENNVNEITIISKVENESKYYYIPYHSFQQKLWASPAYIDKYGNPKSIEELQEHRLLMRKNTDDPRVLFGSTFLKAQLNNLSQLKIYEIVGVRVVDYLCEQGCGIMASAEESIRAGNIQVEQVLESFVGDKIDVYVCVNKLLLENEHIAKTVNWIFECRNKLFRKMGVKPSHSFTPLKY